MEILSCLAHTLTDDQLQQIEDRSIDLLKEIDPDFFNSLINCPDDTEVLDAAAFKLMSIGDRYEAVILPIGSPAFMFRFALQVGLYNDPNCFDHFYFAHSVRESVDVPQPDGSVKKNSSFRHVRFFNQRGSSL